MANSDPWIGTQVGNYRIVEIINSGNFGSVYKGKHLHFEHDPVVAIKLPRATLHTEAECNEFIQEAQLQRQLRHPHILPILDAGFQDGISYLVTMYAVGGSLRDRLGKRSGQPLPLDEALVILTQVGQALHYAHQHQPPVAHRDLKPDNILFDEQGNVLLADFGIAVLLSSIHTKLVGFGGTLSYMAPEQFEGLASPKSDQYALGCIAYELVAGRKVFSIPDPGPNAWWFHHAKVEPVPPRQYNPQLPAHIEQAILMAISKDRVKRHRDVAAFIQAMIGTKEQQRVVGGVPDSPEAWVEAAIAHIQNARFAEALAASDHALALDPNHVNAWFAKSNALANLGREESVIAYDNALILDPNNALGWINKGNVLYALERREEALAAYDHVLALDPNHALAWFNKGNALYKLGRNKEALVAYDHVLALDPNGLGGPGALGMKGVVLTLLERNEEALAAYDRVLVLDPNNVAAWSGKEVTLRALGRMAEAAASERRARELGE